MMKTKIAIIFILLTLFIVPAIAKAAVPVVVFGEYLEDLYNIHENTDLELSLEKFMINLFNVFAQRQEDFAKTFELAKIEKAREDINKLNFEVQKELTGQGIIIEAKDPVTNQKYTIKKEGRMITNPDDFLFEEPLQKARDFVYCYLAPWKHFPLDNDLQYCEDLELSDDNEDEDKKCTTQNVCDLLPANNINGVTQCPSDIQRDNIKKNILNSLVRKQNKWQQAPPESWYSPAICERILNSASCFDKDSCFTNCDFSDEGSCEEKNIKDLNSEERAKISETHPSINRSVAFAKNPTIYEYQQSASNPNNNSMDLEKSLRSHAGNIINQYQTLRQSEYVAGQGIRPEKYLVAFTDKQEDCKRYHARDGEVVSGSGDCKDFDELFFGRKLTINYGGEDNAYSGKLFWFDTENVTSPAVILLQKMAAAAQAQFDLAQKAYKYPANNSELVATTIANGAKEQDEEFSDEKYQIPIQKPSIPAYKINDKGEIEISEEETVDYLYAPWEDPFKYADLPNNYSTDNKGAVPPELGEDYYLNRWYKDINQMYLPQNENSTFSRILVQWFCLEEDTSCYEGRTPKYSEP